MKRIIEVDHVIKRLRLCWKRRDGSGATHPVASMWGKSEYLGMTESYAKNLVAYMDREFPEFEHWTEEQSDG